MIENPQFKNWVCTLTMQWVLCPVSVAPFVKDVLVVTLGQFGVMYPALDGWARLLFIFSLLLPLFSSLLLLLLALGG